VGFHVETPGELRCWPAAQAPPNRIAARPGGCENLLVGLVAEKKSFITTGRRQKKKVSGFATGSTPGGFGVRASGAGPGARPTGRPRTVMRGGPFPACRRGRRNRPRQISENRWARGPVGRQPTAAWIGRAGGPMASAR